MEPAASSGRRYSSVAIILHWLVAIAVIVNWRLAEAAEHLERSDPERGEIMGLHFAIGMSVLLLTVARVIWRLTHKAPPMSAHLAPWNRMLARAVHLLFYVLLLALPLLGWLGMSGYGNPVNMFGLVWPVLPVGFGKDTAGDILEFHGTVGELMILLVGLHILGALKHHFVDKDGILWKMLPFGTPRG